MTDTEVSIPSGGATLSGTFSIPSGEAPYPAALLVAGSGPLDRDGNHKRLPLSLSRDLADELNRAGFATLRFDKRGVGASTGDYLTTGMFDELEDAIAALTWLKQHPQVASTIPVGHSAGAMFAAEMAARGLAPDGAVLLAHTLKTGKETLLWQASEIGETVPGWIKTVMGVFNTSIQKQQQKALGKIAATTQDVVRIQGQKVNAKWMREFLVYDPEPVFRSISVPVFALTGSKDVQVDPADVPVMAAMLEPPSTAKLVDDVDHILRNEPAAKSNPKRYKQQIKKPIDPRVLSHLSEWLSDCGAVEKGKHDVV